MTATKIDHELDARGLLRPTGNERLSWHEEDDTFVLLIRKAPN